MNKYAFVIFSFHYVFATTETSMLSSKNIYQYIHSCSKEHFRNHFREIPFLIPDTEYIEVMRSFLKKILVQGHVFYSFSLRQQDGCCNQIRTKNNYDFKVYQNIYK